jgi:hypothetical protein
MALQYLILPAFLKNENRMAEHIFIIDGGYFYKTAPPIAVPVPVDLFGMPLKDSPRMTPQLHGIFVEKVARKGDFEILLKITGHCAIHDDILNQGETFELTSFVRLLVPASLYQYPFRVGNKYLISTTQITAL